MAIPNRKGKYSYADYLTWGEGERVELIGGEVFDMSPSPSRRHQKILGELFTAFSVFLRDKECEVFFAPFDVRLYTENKQDDEIDHVVQPDLSVVCDPNKLDDKGCIGAPDIIIEVLSPSSVKMDRWTKYQLYEKAGVKAYWVVDPVQGSVEIHHLADERYEFQGVYTEEDTVDVSVLTGMELVLSQIFV
ncbi:Uma2 family endonuclease [Lentibacillus salicampi]|uniref:Uma2 family endonuclease n=2 Tax=Lentibacillus salicampi TaxID=175306 RepID=A0A4Y9A9G2_9BACI|nr:Uma2 family endonuclease [Lentibacillus salicampi]